MRLVTTTSLVGALLAANTSASSPQSSPIPSPSPSADATPVQITDSVFGHLADAKGNALGIICLNFVNRSSKTAVAIEWNVLFADASAHTIVKTHGESVGTFSPNASIEGVPHADKGPAMNIALLQALSLHTTGCFAATIGATVSTALVGVAGVTFSDGSIWMAPASRTSPVSEAPGIVDKR